MAITNPNVKQATVRRRNGDNTDHDIAELNTSSETGVGVRLVRELSMVHCMAVNDVASLYLRDKAS